MISMSTPRMNTEPKARPECLKFKLILIAEMVLLKLPIPKVGADPVILEMRSATELTMLPLLLLTALRVANTTAPPLLRPARSREVEIVWELVVLPGGIAVME